MIVMPGSMAIGSRHCAGVVSESLHPCMPIGGKEISNWEWYGLVKTQSPPSVTHLSNNVTLTNPSQTVLPPGDQVLKYMSIWVNILI